MCAAKCVIFNHQHKGDAYIQALMRHGYHYTEDTRHEHRVDIVLTDHATGHRIPKLDKFIKLGAKHVFVYPHTARPNLVNDILEEHSPVKAQFVCAEGHVEVMRKYGYRKPIHVVGWSFSPVEPFQPREQARLVLFAPIHARCAPMDRDVNRCVFGRLRRLAEDNEIELMVRYYSRGGDDHGLLACGVEMVNHPNIHYMGFSVLTPDYSMIRHADVVVGHQTFAWMAVAMGVPTVMMGEDMPSHLVPRGKPLMLAKHWRSYQNLLAFPYDILAHPAEDTLSILRRCVESDKDIADWKQRMIGSPFDEDKFIHAMETYL